MTTPQRDYLYRELDRRREAAAAQARRATFPGSGDGRALPSSPVGVRARPATRPITTAPADVIVHKIDLRATTGQGVDDDGVWLFEGYAAAPTSPAGFDTVLDGSFPVTGVTVDLTGVVHFRLSWRWGLLDPLAPEDGRFRTAPVLTVRRTRAGVTETRTYTATTAPRPYGDAVTLAWDCERGDVFTFATPHGAGEERTLAEGMCEAWVLQTNVPVVDVLVPCEWSPSSINVSPSGMDTPDFSVAPCPDGRVAAVWADGSAVALGYADSPADLVAAAQSVTFDSTVVDFGSHDKLAMWLSAAGGALWLATLHTESLTGTVQLRRSTNNGASWSLVFTDTDTGSIDNATRDIGPVWRTPGGALVWGSANVLGSGFGLLAQANIRRSVDGGDSWTEVFQITHIESQPAHGFAVYNGTIYTIIYRDNQYRVVTSGDDGVTWSLAPTVGSLYETALMEGCGGLLYHQVVTGFLHLTTDGFVTNQEYAPVGPNPQRDGQLVQVGGIKVYQRHGALRWSP